MVHEDEVCQDFNLCLARLHRRKERNETEIKIKKVERELDFPGIMLTIAFFFKLNFRQFSLSFSL